MGARDHGCTRGGGFEAVGAPQGAIESTLHSSDERQEEGDVAPTCLGPGASLATRSPRPESITCPCRRCRAPVGCTRIALYGGLGGLCVQMQASSRKRISINISASLATRSPRPECITCPCRRCRAPVGCTRIALYGVLGGLCVQMQASSLRRMSINVSSRASRARSLTG